MNGQQAVESMRKEKHHLGNILKDFKPENSDYSPTGDMMSVAQQIHHIAFTVKWFRDGAFGAGFNMDFEALDAETRKQISLEDALKEIDEVYEDYFSFLGALSAADLMAPLPDNPIFGTLPKLVIFAAQADHTAHHRGALSVYLRLLGVTPTMIYGE